MPRLSDFHGTVAKCHCTNHDPEQPMDCHHCFSRGYVAECKACGGKGQTSVPVAGAQSGEMKSTCDKCGGTGHFGVKPTPEQIAALEEKIELQPA